MAEKQTSALQDFEVFAKILSMAFGGGKGNETRIQSKDQLQMALNKMKG